MIDATEIMDIICNPEDAADPWYTGASGACASSIRLLEQPT